MDGGAFYDQSRHWAGGVGGTVGEYTVAGQSKGGVGGQSCVSLFCVNVKI